MDRNDTLNLKDPPDGIRDKVINAAIIAGFNFFSTLAGLGASGLLSDPKVVLCSAGISAAVSFFGSLMVQLGLKKEAQPS